MNHLNPKNYDFLWTVYNQSYLFNSIVLTKSYYSRDFIVISDHNTCTFYVSKKERIKLSKAGLTLFQKNYAKYQNQVIKDLTTAKKFFHQQEIKKIDTLDNLQLSHIFLEIIKVWDKLWQNYFWTEYFCLDRVSDIVKNRPQTILGKKLGKIVLQMGRLKYQERQIINKIFYPDALMTKYYKAIAKRLHSTVEKINNYSYQELISLLNGEKIKIPDRTYVIKGKFSNWQDILGNSAKNIIRQFGEFDKNITTIKGQTGNPGFYKGSVKIVDFNLKLEESNIQIKDMKKGQVLVSGSTGPEMILACKKAGAIVTDEGGITSHAAIVSRELKIPSVIATKYATKILKDGDLVEVDATRGIVKLLNK